MFRLYEDAIRERNAYGEQLVFAVETLDRLEKLLNIRKPSDIKGQSYDTIGRASRDDTTDDRTGIRYLYTKKRIEAYTEILKGLNEQIEKIETDLTKCEGLQYKVFYLNKVKGLSLWRVSEELGYSISHIEKISAEIGRSL